MPSSQRGSSCSRTPRRAATAPTGRHGSPESSTTASARASTSTTSASRASCEPGLAGIRLRRRVKTTQPDQTGRKYPDLIGRDSTADTPGQRYVGDITYLRINGGGFLYLATVIDLYSRKLAGWALADHMRVDLVIDALDAAARERGGTLAGAIFHSDHGSTYTAVDYAKACARLAVTQSMGAIGSSADNALAESFNATAKREMLAGEHAFTSETTARRAVFRWATRYNTKRRHSACDYLSPNAYEKAHTTTMAEAA